MKEMGMKILLILAVVISMETTFLAAKSFRYFPMKHFSSRTDEIDVQKALAEAYMNQGLYKQAIESYERYINFQRLDQAKKSNLSYIIGNIYMENLYDYDNALACFVRAKVYNPSNASLPEINRKIVACLEKLNRPADAEREMSKATSLDKTTAQSGSGSEEGNMIVAKVGERSITMSELDKEIANLPPQEAGVYREKKKKLEFLRQYVTEELLYDSAKRIGLDRDKRVLDAADFAKRQMMISMLVEDEVNAKVAEPGESDLRLYYDANKTKYADDKKGQTAKTPPEFEQVKDRVRFDYISMKRQEKLMSFLDNLGKSKDITVYDAQFKEE